MDFFHELINFKFAGLMAGIERANEAKVSDTFCEKKKIASLAIHCLFYALNKNRHHFLIPNELSSTLLFLIYNLKENNFLFGVGGITFNDFQYI